MKVWLDDVREAPIGWERVFTSKEAIDALRTGAVTKISLDHDLSDDHYFGKSFGTGTGYEVILWLEIEVRENRNFKMPEVELHTANPVGRLHMQAGLKRIKEYLTIEKDRQCEELMRIGGRF